MKLLFFLLLSGVVSAQMVETIAMQGVMQQSAGAQTAKDLNKAMQMIHQNEEMQQEALNEMYTGRAGLVSQINALKKEIRKKFGPAYEHVYKNKLSGSYLAGYDWEIGSVDKRKFYIKINNLNRKECEKVKRTAGSGMFFINEVKNNKCQKTNDVKVIY